MTVRRVDEVIPANGEASGVEVRHLTRTGDAELKVIDVDPGSSTPFHSHPHAHEAVIVSGAGAVLLKDVGQPLSPGDVLSLASGEPHAIVGRGTERLRFLCMDRLIE
jgi:quercetin dioxygenase-like cupin family protein